MVSDATRATLEKPEVQNLIAVVFVGSAVASAASAYMAAHIDAKKDTRKEVYTAIGLSALTTLASVAWAVYKADKSAVSP